MARRPTSPWQGTERSDVRGCAIRAHHNLMTQEIRKIWTPERACIIRVMLPGVAQARPPLEYGGKAVPQGHQMGFTPYLTAPGHTGLAACMGSVLGLERLDIVRHSVTPAHVKTRRGHETMPLPSATGQAQPVLPCRPGNASVHKIHWGEGFLSQLRARRQAVLKKKYRAAALCHGRGKPCHGLSKNARIPAGARRVMQRSAARLP